LGYDFNTVEFAVREGIPYAIDFCNPAPDADLYSIGQENFDWIVENAANMAIERAQAHREGFDNLTWGTFVKNGTKGFLPNTMATAAEVKQEVAEVKKSSENKLPNSTTNIKSSVTKAAAKPVSKPAVKEVKKNIPSTSKPNKKK